MKTPDVNHLKKNQGYYKKKSNHNLNKHERFISQASMDIPDHDPLKNTNTLASYLEDGEKTNRSKESTLKKSRSLVEILGLEANEKAERQRQL